jgi:hypothetical protein
MFPMKDILEANKRKPLEWDSHRPLSLIRIREWYNIKPKKSKAHLIPTYQDILDDLAKKIKEQPTQVSKVEMYVDNKKPQIDMNELMEKSDNSKRKNYRCANYLMKLK